MKRHLSQKFLALALVAWTMSAGCTAPGGLRFSPEAQPARSYLYIADVPFYPEDSHQCGPASLAAVLNYWGIQATPEEVYRATYKPQFKGTPEIDLWSYASAREMDTRMRSAALEDLKRYLEQRIPVIAFVDTGSDWFPAPHFVVVVGLDPVAQVVVMHNGKEQSSRIPYAQFMEAWRKTKNWTLVVRPKPPQLIAAPLGHTPLAAALSNAVQGE
jgi:ABC-type bacteriocin/lantibiotic exporter with double-glycine peptidase domain